MFPAYYLFFDFFDFFFFDVFFFAILSPIDAARITGRLFKHIYAHSVYCIYKLILQYMPVYQGICF